MPVSGGRNGSDTNFRFGKAKFEAYSEKLYGKIQSKTGHNVREI